MILVPDPRTHYWLDVVTISNATGKPSWRPQSPADAVAAQLQEGATHRSSDYVPARQWNGDTYDKERENTPKWQRETELVREALQGFGPGTTVLDVPVGTGRFVELYESMGFHVLGLDVNDSMLRAAQAKAKGQDCFFRFGDARALDVADKSFDVSLCIRLFRWISAEECVRVLRELQRVTRKRIIFNARTEEGHPYSRPKSLIESALDGWEIEREDEVEPGFYMFALCPKS